MTKRIPTFQHPTVRRFATLLLAALTLSLASATMAQENQPNLVQVVALDECDPTTFNAVLGPDFCKNVALAALGYATTFNDFFALAAAGTPDPGGTSSLTWSTSKKERR